MQRQQAWPPGPGGTLPMDGVPPDSFPNAFQTYPGMMRQDSPAPHGMSQAGLDILQRQIMAAQMNQMMGDQVPVNNHQGQLQERAENSLRVNGAHVNPMMNYDLPPSDFSKAVNFDLMMGQALLQQNGMQLDSNGVLNMESVESIGSMSGQGDTSSDLMEQQQAKEQAKLMARFKQLREMQKRQQDMLLLQQEQQLAMLRQEQQKVQVMLARQREAQWGGGAAQNGLGAAMPDKAEVTGMKTPKKATHLRGTIPQALAQATMLQARRTQALQAHMLQPAGMTAGELQQDIKLGRPVPHIEEKPTPEQFRFQGNPSLDSDTGSISTVTDEEVFPLPDTASEASDQSNLPRGSWDHQPISSTPNHMQKHVPNQNIPEKSSKGSPKSQLNPDPGQLYFKKLAKVKTGTNKANLLQDHEYSADKVSHQEELSNPLGEALVKAHNVPVHVPTPAKHALMNGAAGFAAGMHPVQSKFDEDANGLGLQETGVPTRDDGDADDQSDAEVYTDSDEEVDGEEDEEDDQVDADGDDRPIQGIGGKKKTFEELLEEELQKENEKIKKAEQAAAAGAGKNKKMFLRKGQGLARFSGKPVRRTAPGRKTAGSRPPPGKPPEKKSPPVIEKPSAEREKPPAVKKQKKRKTLPKKPGPSDAKSKSPQPMAAVTSPKPARREIKNSAKMPVQEKIGISAPHVKAENNTAYSEDAVGEISFMNRVAELEQKQEIEVEELEEFEILEKYADDNASFLSNASAVNRVLREEKGVPGKPPAPKMAPEQDQGTRPGTVPSTEDTDVDETLELDSSDCNSESSGSDTETDDIIDVIMKNDVLTKDIIDAAATLGKPSVNAPSEKLQSLRLLHRKIATRDVKSPSKVDTHLDKVDLDSEIDDTEGQGRASHKETEVTQRSNVNIVTAVNTEDQDLTNNANHKPGRLVNKRTVDQSGANRQESNSNTNSSADKAPARASVVTQSDQVQRELMFEDENSWGDTSNREETHSNREDAMTPDIELQGRIRALSPGNVARQLKSPIKKDIVPKPEIKPTTSEEYHQSTSAIPGAEGQSTEEPPTSKLVQKLFPKLREEKPERTAQTHQLQQQLQATQRPVVDGAQSKALRDKLAELEREIERFRTENATLEKLRLEREDGLSHFKKEMQEFEKQKNDELKRLQEFKAEELRKLKKEKKVFDQYQKAMKAGPDKKEREEIESLKNQVSDLQDEMKRKESRWTANSRRLRDRVEQLESENLELKQEIKVLEKKRLEAWQKDSNKPSKQDVKSSTLSQPAVPKPASKPSNSGPDADLRLSASLETELRPNLRPNLHTDLSEESEPSAPRKPSFSEKAQHMATPQAWVPQATNTALSVEQRQDQEAGSKKPIPRKRASVRLSITNSVDKGNGEYEEVQHADGKVEKIYTNGAREILFPNGTRKQIAGDGQSIIVSFFNGDIKQIMPDQRVVYYYSETQITHTTYPDGLEIVQFANNQVEKYYPDGTKEITYTDGTIQYLFPNGTEEIIFQDGTVIRVDKNRNETLEFPNGQREIRTKDFRRREYPDGTTKTIYPDGRQESRYANGRLRIKDKSGNIIVDRIT